MINVRISVKQDENIEKAIRRFKRSCERAGIKAQVKSRRYYVKPSEVARIKKAKQVKRKKPKRVEKKRSARSFLPVELRPFHLYD